MYDPAFTAQTLRAQVRRVDFMNFPSLKGKGVLDQEIQGALELIRTPGALAALISYSPIGGKLVAKASNYRAQLVLRKVSENLESLLDRSASSRESMVQALRLVLAEAVPYRAYKLDVQSCYESFDRESIRAWLSGTARLGTTMRLTMEILDKHWASGGRGIPRGLAMSAALAEALLRDFDIYAKSIDGVFFYQRFVDDIVVITHPQKDQGALILALENELPKGLEFSKKKKKIFAVPVLGKGAGTSKLSSLDFLGYELIVDVGGSDPTSPRQRSVRIDIAKKKVDRIKTRIARSIADFVRSHDFSMLNARLRHLTSNLSMIDRSSGLPRMVGIYFNYPLVDVNKSHSLRDLDYFLRYALRSKKGKLYSKMYVLLSEDQRRTLLRHSFLMGAKNKRFYQMNLRQLGRVQGCWKYAK